jgi:Na+/H+ antiporter NhaB
MGRARIRALAVLVITVVAVVGIYLIYQSSERSRKAVSDANCQTQRLAQVVRAQDQQIAALRAVLMDAGIDPPPAKPVDPSSLPKMEGDCGNG